MVYDITGLYYLHDIRDIFLHCKRFKTSGKSIAAIIFD